MRVLFLSNWYPDPPDNGSKLRILDLLRGLGHEHEITLISFADAGHAGQQGQLRRICRTVHMVPRRTYNPRSWRALLGLVRATPRSLVDTFDRQFAAQVRDELHRHSFDLVVASQWDTAAYFPAFAGLPAIFEELELGVFQGNREQASSWTARQRHQLTLLKLRIYLRRLLRYYAVCTVVSEVERRAVRAVAPAYNAVEVVPNCIDLDNYPCYTDAPRPDTLIFSGSFRYSANHDAMQWFVRDVYPLIRARVPKVKLIITGDHANLPLPDMTGVHLSGHLKDIKSQIGSAWVSLAPIRVGGGTRLKILEAMALRTPVVSTSKGAEGLGVEDGVHLLIGDSPHAFAEAVCRLLTEPGLRQQLADNAFELVRSQYNWQVIMPKFLGLVERVARSKEVGAVPSRGVNLCA